MVRWWVRGFDYERSPGRTSHRRTHPGVVEPSHPGVVEPSHPRVVEPSHPRTHSRIVEPSHHRTHSRTLAPLAPSDAPPHPRTSRTLAPLTLPVRVMCALRVCASISTCSLKSRMH